MNAKAKYILELPITQADKNYIETIKNAQKSKCDIIGLKFNIKDNTETIEEAAKMLQRLLPYIEKPLMVRGSGDDSVDKRLLPALIEELPYECIIAHANENTYKSIVPSVIKGNHKLVIRTPIDINLCKEMNILVSDMGLDADKIIIDTDIGGLGYGLEYGYSIMERIKIEASKGDKYLNMPIISFAAEETSKTKEAKNEKLAVYLEIASASAVLAAGADYIVLNNTQTVKTMENL